MTPTEGALEAPQGLRPSLTALVAKLRFLIQDTGTPPVFTDDELGGLLDEYAIVENYLTLDGDVIRGNPDTYLVFRGPGFWEDVRVYNANNVLLTTPGNYSMDTLRGIVTLAASTTEGVTISGTRVDLYGAAGAACTIWASKLKLDYDVAVGGDSFTRSQKITQLLTMADEFTDRSELGGLDMGGDAGAVSQERTDWRGI